MSKVIIIENDNAQNKRKNEKNESKGKGKYSEKNLREYAVGVINERIKFCSEYKKDEDLDKCVCEAIIRWLRLFDKGYGKSKELGRLRVKMVEKVFIEMVKAGKLKCGKLN